MRALLLALLILAAPAALLSVVPHPAAATEGWARGDGTHGSRAALNADLADARFVLLGETHDNPHHHAAQASLLRSMVDAGRKPAVVWEMAPRDQQSAIDAWAAGPDADDADGFAEAVGWAESGWPDFALYRPIVDAAIDGGLAMVAGNLPSGATRSIAQGGLAALGDRTVDAWRLSDPLSDEATAAHLDAVFDGHCRLVPRERLGTMVDVQVARDASLAAAMVGHPDGAVLIAGRGHVRTDIGVPLHLRRLAPEMKTVAVGLSEGQTVGAFDWMRAFRAADRDDPCESLRQRFKAHN
ncbi:MAG: ChaN family lipoprotein [Thalassobaculaceae bacterium]